MILTQIPADEIKQDIPFPYINGNKWTGEVPGCLVFSPFPIPKKSQFMPVNYFINDDSKTRFQIILNETLKFALGYIQ